MTGEPRMIRACRAATSTITLGWRISSDRLVERGARRPARSHSPGYCIKAKISCLFRAPSVENIWKKTWVPRR